MTSKECSQVENSYLPFQAKDYINIITLLCTRIGGCYNESQDLVNDIVIRTPSYPTQHFLQRQLVIKSLTHLQCSIACQLKSRKSWSSVTNYFSSSCCKQQKLVL